MAVETMKAVRIHGPGDFSIERIEIPCPGRNEVLVKIQSVAICGSDPGIFSGKVLHNGWPPYFPFVAGHEFAGEVVALGEGTVKLRLGERVAGEAHCGCGICEMCQRGLYNNCLNYGYRSAGHRHYGHKTAGCNTQYQTYDQKVLTPLPENISYNEGAMVDTAGTANNALRLTGVVPGGWTAIIGPGPMGIMAMLLAKARGSKTIMIGRGQRLQIAKEMGATEVIDFETVKDIVAAVRAATGGYGAHQVIEAAGSSSTYPEAVQMTRKGGHVALISIPAKDGQEIALKSLVMNQITLHGVRANPNCSAEVLALMSSGVVNVKRMITHEFSIDEIHQAFDTFQKRRDGALKVIVHPN